jgi:hypothetical protein
VKASPESGAFNQGRSGGQQVRTPLVREVAAVQHYLHKWAYRRVSFGLS